MPPNTANGAPTPSARSASRAGRSHFLRLLALTIAAAVGACQGSSEDVGEEPGPGDAPDGGGAGGAPKWLGVEGERLAALPPPGNATSDRFATSDACAQCHLAGDEPVLRDAKGRDVSPVGTWRTSAMALAARDPYYLATFADEVAFRPNLGVTVQTTCTRCHAPEASVDLEVEGKFPTFESLVSAADTSKTAHLGREGVACTLCHQIQDQNLGTFASFTGGFTISTDRRIFGPYADPTQDPMRLLVNYLPVYSAHIQKSSLCATCHTVVTKPRDAKGNVGPDFPEQVPYLEWLASAFSNEGAPGQKAAACQDCHMSAVDDDGGELSVPIARRPAGLKARKPFWRHGFEGGNVALSRFAAVDPAWIGLPLSREDHERQALANEAMLRRAASIEVSATREGGGVEIAVKVTNESGHKLPTGYPSRRAILHVRVSGPGGETLFESGRTDAYGRLVRRDGASIEPSTFMPHRDVIEREDDVQIYESVPVDVTGKLAHRPLDAHHYAKDNRLVPFGFNRKNSFSAYTAPVGTDDDADWGSSDVVRYRVGDVPAGAVIDVRLLFQNIRPHDVEVFADEPTPAARKLFDFVIASPLVPVVIAERRASAP